MSRKNWEDDTFLDNVVLTSADGKTVVNGIRPQVAANEGDETTSQFRERYSRLREGFRPERIRLLFVAESPLAPTGDELRFFYNPEQDRWDYLYSSVMLAIFADFEHRPGQKGKWLRKFQEDGYYLIDAIDHPVNKLPRGTSPRA